MKFTKHFVIDLKTNILLFIQFKIFFCSAVMNSEKKCFITYQGVSKYNFVTLLRLETKR